MKTKKLFIGTLLLSMAIVSCKKDNVEPNQQQLNSNSYSVVVHQFEIKKRASFKDFCGASGELTGDFIFGIDIGNATGSNYGIPFSNFRDSLMNANSSNQNTESTYSYSTIQFGNFLNRIKLRTTGNTHDYSYFGSASNTKKFDYVVTNTSYTPFFYYRYYPTGTNNCPQTKGSITYGSINVNNIGNQGDDTDHFISNDTLYIVTTYEL